MRLLPACCLPLLLLSLYASAEAPHRVAVASAHPIATQAGLEILAAGGNAFDAAIAISATLAVVEPYSSGLGGGGFFLLRQAGNGESVRYRFLDARERAPAAATPDMYRRDGEVQRRLSLDGPLAAGIPGLPAALASLASGYGRLPLSRSLAPAIQAAKGGFATDAVYRARAEYRLSALRDDPESARLFLSEGEVPVDGTVVRQDDLADTLESLARRGHAGFYSGTVAERLVSAVRKHGGVWTLDDLSNYHVVEREPIRASLGSGRELISAPPPSAGGIALAQSLGILNRLPWQEADRLGRVQYVVESLRRAYRDRGLLGDPDFVAIPTRRLLDPGYLSRLAQGIHTNQATPSRELPPAPPWIEGHHTTHFTVIDGDGQAVAATLSINLPFGAAFTVPDTGVLLNDEMDDFAADVAGSNVYGLTGSEANSVAPGKRPLSSMSPTFIESDRELASFGTPGGSRIPSMVLLAILDYLDGKPVKQWPATPRYHHQYLPDRIEYEPGAFTEAERRALQSRGYTTEATKRPYGNQQVLRWDKVSGTVEAASDPRGVGQADSRPLTVTP